MNAETNTLACPNCGSAHLVEEGTDHYLCLYCHSVSKTNGTPRLAATGWLCPHCGVENAGESASCSACHQEHAPTCLKCNALMAVWDQTCPRCGTDQAAFRQQQLARQKERQQARTVTPRRPRQNWRPWRLWRVGWLIWPLMWLLRRVGETVQTGLRSLPASGLNPTQLPDHVVPLAVGACIFGVGAVLFLVSAVPFIRRSN